MQIFVSFSVPAGGSVGSADAPGDGVSVSGDMGEEHAEDVLQRVLDLAGALTIDGSGIGGSVTVTLQTDGGGSLSGSLTRVAPVATPPADAGAA